MITLVIGQNGARIFFFWLRFIGSQEKCKIFFV